MTSNDLTILYMRFWPERHGGVEEHLWRLASNACVHTRVTVLTENRLQIKPTEQPLPNLVIHRDEPTDMGKLWRWPAVPRVRWWMKQLKAHPPKGWIWAIEPSAAMAAILLGYGKQTVFNPPCCCHAMHQVWKADHQVQSMKIDWYLRQMERFVYRRAGRVIVASESLGRQFTLGYGARLNVHVVPRGADQSLIQQLPDKEDARKKLDIAPDAFVIGFVGRLDPCKDIPHLLQACAKPGLLRLQDRILIVGTGSDEQRIRDTAQTLGLTNRMIFTGSLKGEQLHEAYAAMDTFTLPSVYEGYGMVILEAMAAGLPVIGRFGNWKTSFTSMSEMIRPGVTGLLMHPTDVKNLSAKLDWMIQHPRQRQDMGKRGRTELAKRPWSDVIADYLTVLGLMPAEPTPSVKQVAA